MNKIELVKLDEFDPIMGHIYSVAVDDSDDTLYDSFLEENVAEYHTELEEITSKLKVMSLKTGFTDNYFKLNEGKPGDGICAITDLKKKLRMYCIRFGNILLVLGGGGPKSPKIRALQEDPKLLLENSVIKKVSDAMANAIKEKTLKIGDDGMLLGNTIIEL